MILELGAGTQWKLEAAGRSASKLLHRLSVVLGGLKDHPDPRPQVSLQQLRLSCEGDSVQVLNESSGELFSFTQCNFADSRHWSGYAGEERILKLIALSLVLAAQSQVAGGVLLHGALAERDGTAALLLGPSGRGKTTASRILAPPWRSLSDDMALLVPGAAGRWRAHPWPTWSALRDGEPGRSWDVQRGVDIGGIFVLNRAPGGSAERIGPGRAACLLLESFEQAWWAGTALFSGEAISGIRRQAFDNIGALVKAVPTFLLPIGPGGPFWEKIEETLDEA